MNFVNFRSGPRRVRGELFQRGAALTPHITPGALAWLQSVSKCPNKGLTQRAAIWYYLVMMLSPVVLLQAFHE